MTRVRFRVVCSQHLEVTKFSAALMVRSGLRGIRPEQTGGVEFDIENGGYLPALRLFLAPRLMATPRMRTQPKRGLRHWLGCCLAGVLG